VTPFNPAPERLSQHISRTLRLALPVMVARAGMIVLVAVDTAMTGHAGAEQLAFYALGFAPQIFVLLVGLGLMLGTVVMTAQAEGAGRPQACGSIWRVALIHAAAIGVLQWLLMFGGERFLRLTGQSAELAHGGGQVMIALGWSLPAMLMFIATTLFLEGIGRPLPGLVVMLVANIVNVALNALLIYGYWGLPALGAEGAAWATTAVRWLMFVAILGYVLLRVDPRHYGLRGPIEDFRRLGRTLRRIGYPMAITHGLESGAFSCMTLLAGLLGAVQVAAFQIAMTAIALVFMSAQGFATAASIRVGNAVGRSDPRGVQIAGWTATALACVVLALFALLFSSQAQWVVGWFSSDAEVMAVALVTVTLTGLVLIPDGLQAVLIGALRGMGDVWPAAGLFLIAFWLVMVPAGYLLGVWLEYGAAGLIIAILIGTTVAAVFMAWRFQKIARRAVVAL